MSTVIKMEAGKPRVGLIYGLSSFVDGVPSPGIAAASRLIRLLEPLSDEITWVTAKNLQMESNISDKVVPVKIRWNDIHEKPLLSQIYYHLSQQIKITLKLVKLNGIDVFIFAHGLDFYILPISLARIFLGKKVIIKSDGRSSVATRQNIKGSIKSKIALIIKAIEEIDYFLADRVIVDSAHAVSIYNMQSYENKTWIGISDSYINTNLFSKTTELRERKYDLGYIGRFQRKKGSLEFVQSLPLVLGNNHLRAVMIGGGPQDYELRRTLTATNIQNKVEIIGWVRREKLAGYLNDIKLVVIPSYGEGMPITALEAMACGCIVVTTPAGSLPEIIKDGRTGFILESNSARHIADGIARALSHPNLDSIAQNAQTLIKKEYAYEVVMERCRHALSELMDGRK